MTVRPQGGLVLRFSLSPNATTRGGRLSSMHPKITATPLAAELPFKAPNQRSAECDVLHFACLQARVDWSPAALLRDRCVFRPPLSTRQRLYLFNSRVRRSAQYKVAANMANAVTTATNHMRSRGMVLLHHFIAAKEPRVHSRAMICVNAASTASTLSSDKRPATATRLSNIIVPDA